MCQNKQQLELTLSVVKSYVAQLGGIYQLINMLK